jgi:protein-S-isoprenylcysteine O-methyltransferase Ste14
MVNLNPRNVIFADWVVFLVVWGLAALRTNPTVRRQTFAQRLGQGLPMVFCALLLLEKQLAIGPLGWRFAPNTAAVGWTGATITTAGVVIAIAARFFLGRNWSGWVTVKKGHQLIRGGPYAVVRHPIYSGILLGFLGFAIAVGQVRGLVAVVCATLSFRVKSLQEERFMEEEFGDDYREYRKHVKALIPFVW